MRLCRHGAYQRAPHDGHRYAADGSRETRFGRDHAQAVWDAGLAALSQIDAIVRDEEIACDFAWVPGYLHRPPEHPDDETSVFAEEAALAADLGFDAAFINDVPLIGGPGVVFDNQARFHPRKYLAGVARAIEAAGGRIYEHHGAEEFSDKPLSVKANGCTLTCDYLVLATHTPLMGNTSTARATLFQTKLALYTSYVVGGRVKKGRLPDALWWDTADAYHFLRLEPLHDDDLVIFGGEDHKTGQAPDTRACYDPPGEGAEVAPAGRRADPSVVGAGHRDAGRPAVHRRNGRAAVRRDRDFPGNGLTFGTLGGDHGVRSRAWTRESLAWIYSIPAGRRSAARGIICARTRTIRTT